VAVAAGGAGVAVAGTAVGAGGVVAAGLVAGGDVGAGVAAGVHPVRTVVSSMTATRPSDKAALVILVGIFLILRE
jgi:hypothetical protein